MSQTSSSCILHCASKTLDLSIPHVMGIINATPDSFYAPSRCKDNYLIIAEQMLKDGATIFDVGGESTRPTAEQTPSEQEELDRVIPVIECIAAHFDVVISVDTSSPLVMQAAVAAGAGIINDVRGLQREGAVAVAAKANVPVILMHSLVETLSASQPSDDVVQWVANDLLKLVDRCRISGIDDKNILLDPGFGGGFFGKDTARCIELMNGMQQISDLGFPVLAGVSRKGFIGDILQVDLDNRLLGSVAAALICVQRGASIVRVHDVKETADVIKLWRAVSV